MPTNIISSTLTRRALPVLAASAVGLGLAAPMASAQTLAAPAAPTAPAQARVAPAQAVLAAPLPGSPEVGKESSQAQVKALQMLLNANGQHVTVDGALGAKTEAAVTAFQKSHGLTADGDAGPATLGALVSTVREGSRGDVVEALQVLLAGEGHKVTVDGVFGAGTKSAVMAVQGKFGLPKDGIAGPRTWGALFDGEEDGDVPAANCDSVKASVPQSATTVAAGIRVHKCLADRVTAMVAEAKREGVTLTGGGWRDINTQIELRKKHCGPSHYDIYDKPSGQCHPPTARPGRSMHERGLAIDFANSGSHSTRVYKWLAANASKYHLHNLASEPWHWSWNGN